MTKVVSPSEPITDGQIGNVNELLAAALRKQKELPSEAVQEVLRNQGGPMAKELLAVIRKYVDAVSNLITLIVKVDRTRSPQQALKVTGRAQYVTDSVVAKMPNGTDEEVEIIFFNLGREASNDNLMKEYELRGLDPVDPHTLAAFNEAEPAFADKHPNGTQWKDKDDQWCFAVFYRWGGVRFVGVSRHDDGWRDYWWFAGVRK